MLLNVFLVLWIIKVYLVGRSSILNFLESKSMELIQELICIFFTQSKKNSRVHWIGQHCGNKRSMDFEEH
jgi:hypothetical protein